MKNIFCALKELSSWRFTVDEVSTGIYKVSGMDEARRSVERIGTDPDILIKECKNYAVRIINEKQLANLLSELATELQISSKPETAEFFLSIKEDISNANGIIDSQKILDQLISSGAITQYADFSFKQELLFNKIYEAAKMYKESL